MLNFQPRGKGDVTVEPFSRQTKNTYTLVAFDWVIQDLDFEIRILDFAIKCESKNGFHLSRFQLRNPNQDLMDFLFTVRW